MADGDRVNDDVSVVRYAKPSAVEGDVVTHVAFERRPVADDDGLSVSRLGVLSTDPDEDLRLLRPIMHCHYSMKPNGRLAQLNVGDIVAASERARVALWVEEHEAAATAKCVANSAHALIMNLPFKGTETGELSATAAGDALALRVERLHPAT